jgi:hypothetical protein
LLNLILLMEKYKKSLNENNYYDVLKWMSWISF